MRMLVSLGALAVLAVLALGLMRSEPEPSEPVLAVAEPVADEPAPPTLRGATAPPEVAEAAPATEEEELDWNAREGVSIDDAPEDPLETGSCALHIELRRDDDEAPFDSAVHLWRLDAPANEDWNVGDRKYAQGKTEGGSATWHELPAGRYRLYVPGQRKGSDDPAAFEVVGAHTYVTRDVPAPRRAPVYVRLYDELDRPLATAWRRSGGVGSVSSSGSGPDWAKRRTLRGNRYIHVLGLGGCSGSGGGRGRPIPMDLHAEGLLLGRFSEPDRERSWSSSYELGADGTSTVSVFVRKEDAEPVTLIAPVLSMTLIHDAILLPDGTRAIDAGASIRAQAKAIPAPSDLTERPWREMTIEVKATLKGYESLTLDFSQRMSRRTFTMELAPE